MATATEVKERPILFSGAMVRAILEDRKSQSRRIVKPQPPEDWSPIGCERYHPAIEHANGYIDAAKTEIFGAYNEDWGVACPYGGPGDRLWVRECWRFGYPVKPEGPSMNIQSLQYRADYEEPTCVPWRPSIHMKRKDSRITLEIVDVRIERLHDLSERDAEAEGIWSAVESDPTIQDMACRIYGNGNPVGVREYFAILWSQINGPRGFNWSNNSWVWVIEFKTIATA